MPHIVLRHSRSPGDIAVMTALVRDIALTRPGEFKIDVDTPSSKPLWDNNPYITPFKHDPPADTQFLTLDYGAGLREQNFEPIHFLRYFHRDFEVKTRWKIPLTQPWPDLHLSTAEKNHRPIAAPYWVCMPGGKSDFMTKIWPASNWSTLVRRLAHHGLGCVQLGSVLHNERLQHINPNIPEVGLNLVGRTNLREMLQLIYHSEGVICGVTAAMHFAAGLHKPCVVLAGGREAWWWYGYVPENKGFGDCLQTNAFRAPHRLLHTIGLLGCCRTHGCWRSQLITDKPRQLCEQQVVTADGAAPVCLQMITPAMVETAVLSYYADGQIRTPGGTRLEFARTQHGGVCRPELSGDRRDTAVPTQ